MFFDCPAIDTSTNNADLEDELVAPEHDEDVASTHHDDDDPDAHVDMAKTARK